MFKSSRKGTQSQNQYLFCCFVVVMRSTSWCAPSPTMARTCLNRSSPREWAHTKASSTTSNGMSCEWLPWPLSSSLLYLFTLFDISPTTTTTTCWLVLSLHTADTCPCRFQDQLPHSGSCSPAGVHTESDSVWGVEPECRRLSRFQQTEESSRAAGQSLYATLWLQTVRREEQPVVAGLMFMSIKKKLPGPNTLWLNIFFCVKQILHSEQDICPWLVLYNTVTCWPFSNTKSMKDYEFTSLPHCKEYCVYFLWLFEFFYVNYYWLCFAGCLPGAAGCCVCGHLHKELLLLLALQATARGCPQRE